MTIQLAILLEYRYIGIGDCWFLLGNDISIMGDIFTEYR